jgi:Ca2+-binding RTX toxin-like protein
MQFTNVNYYVPSLSVNLWDFLLRGDDEITLSGSIGTVFGDAPAYTGVLPFMGGDDVIRLDASATPSNQGADFDREARIYGDAVSVSAADPAIFGDDVIDARLAGDGGTYFFTLIGDTETLILDGLGSYGADTVLGSGFADFICGDYSVGLLDPNVDPAVLNEQINMLDGGADRLFGYGEGDLIFGGGGADYIDGGSGSDQIYGGAGNDRIIGGTDGDVLYGLGGNDIVLGGAGNDELYGGAAGDSADRLEGGDGGDLYVLGANIHTIIETSADLLVGGVDTVRLEASVSGSFTLGANLENLVLAAQATGVLLNGTGNALANEITGDDNNNILDGGLDTLVDVLVGNGGNDTFVLGASLNDTVSDTAGSDTIVSSISRSLATFASIENLILTGSATSAGTGNALLNTVTGSAGANTLDGGADALADMLIGGLGNDAYIIRTATDNIVELLNGGTDKAVTTVSYVLGAGDSIEFLEISAALPNAAINLVGNEIGQRITGNSAINVLNGGGGADTLVAGLGNDNLTGGTGADVFLFNSATGVGTPGLVNVDTITDFNVVDDIIHLENSLFDTFVTLSAGVLNPAFFKSSATGAPTDLDDRITYSTTTGALYYDSNGSAAGGAKQIALLTTKPLLTAADFLVV